MAFLDKPSQRGSDRLPSTSELCYRDEEIVTFIDEHQERAGDRFYRFELSNGTAALVKTSFDDSRLDVAGRQAAGLDLGCEILDHLEIPFGSAEKSYSAVWTENTVLVRRT